MTTGNCNMIYRVLFFNKSKKAKKKSYGFYIDLFIIYKILVFCSVCADLISKIFHKFIIEQASRNLTILFSH